MQVLILYAYNIHECQYVYLYKISILTIAYDLSTTVLYACLYVTFLPIIIISAITTMIIIDVDMLMLDYY